MHSMPQTLLTLALTAPNVFLLNPAGATIPDAAAIEANSSSDSAAPTAPPLSLQGRARLDMLKDRLRTVQGTGDRRAEAETYNSIGLLHYSARQFDLAVSAFTSALDLYRRLGNQRGESTQLSQLGATFAEMGMGDDALKFYLQSLPLWTSLDRAQEAATLGRIAEIFRGQRDADEALYFDQKALQIFTDLGEQSGRAAVFNNIGLVYFMAGKEKKGMEYFNQARDTYRRAGDQEGEAQILDNIATAYSHSGDQNKALAAFDLALSLYRHLGQREQEALILENIGKVYTMLGQTKNAHDFHERAVALNRKTDDEREGIKTLEDCASQDAKGRRRNANPPDSQEAEFRARTDR